MCINQREYNLGFTLLEVMLAVALLALLSGTMIALVQSSLESAIITESIVRKNDNKYGYIELCRRLFRTLPGEVEFVAYKDHYDEYEGDNLIFYNAPHLMQWGGEVDYERYIVSMAFISREGEGKQMAVKRMGRVPETEWFPLLENVEYAKWRYFDQESQQWLNEWGTSVFRPSAVELTLKLLDEAESTRSVFWLPPIITNSGRGDYSG